MSGAHSSHTAIRVLGNPIVRSKRFFLVYSAVPFFTSIAPLVDHGLGFGMAVLVSFGAAAIGFAWLTLGGACVRRGFDRFDESRAEPTFTTAVLTLVMFWISCSLTAGTGVAVTLGLAQGWRLGVIQEASLVAITSGTIWLFVLAWPLESIRADSDARATAQDATHQLQVLRENAELMIAAANSQLRSVIDKRAVATIEVCRSGLVELVDSASVDPDRVRQSAREIQLAGESIIRGIAHEVAAGEPVQNDESSLHARHDSPRRQAPATWANRGDRFAADLVSATRSRRVLLAGPISVLPFALPVVIYFGNFGVGLSVVVAAMGLVTGVVWFAGRLSLALSDGPPSWMMLASLAVVFIGSGLVPILIWGLHGDAVPGDSVALKSLALIILGFTVVTLAAAIAKSPASVVAVGGAVATLALVICAFVVESPAHFEPLIVGTLVSIVVLATWSVVAIQHRVRTASRYAESAVVAGQWELRVAREREAITISRLATFLHGQVQGELLALALNLFDMADAVALGKLSTAESRSRVLSVVAGLDRVEETLHGDLAVLVPHDGEALALVLEEISRTWVGVVSISIAAIQPIALDGLSSAQSESVLEIVREAINNAVKHGSATQIDVSIEVAGHELAIVITDNGIGYRHRDEHGIGMSRIAALTSSWAISNVPERGTVLICRLPRHESQDV